MISIRNWKQKNGIEIDEVEYDYNAASGDIILRRKQL